MKKSYNFFSQLRNILYKIFTNKKKVEKNNVSNISIKDEKYEERLRSYIYQEIKKSPYIKQSHVDYVYKHFLSKTPISYGDTLLTTEEKRSLGLNTRAKISKELIEALNNNWQDSYSIPRYIISDIYHAAATKQVSTINFNKLIKIGIKEYKFIVFVDDACDWCNSMNNKIFTTNINFNDLIEQNCTCSPYCKSDFEAIIKY